MVPEMAVLVGAPQFSRNFGILSGMKKYSFAVISYYSSICSQAENATLHNLV